MRISSNFYPLTCTKLAGFTVLAVIIQSIGISLFIVGFFPVKPTLSGLSGLESFYPPGFDSSKLIGNISTFSPEELKSVYKELSGVAPLFDRLILMVIDGLPAEFVLGKNGWPPAKILLDAMPYTQSLLAKGLAIGYHAKAAPPTVTMPRIKALVSGAIGGFLDVATNFNTQAFLDDNLIAQFFRIGWRMVMLGDETRLKLFPDMFARYDGVSSFFVKDAIQVDYNVSRHLTTELNNTNWDLLILHYLGLDHVGHVGGRNSILMGPKLMEMDEAIKRIHSSILEETCQRTLLMVVSDHGMTDGGNHGGSSYEETDSLALFVGAQRNWYSENNRETFQVDIASTLALLFGVPIPQNNVGTVMEEVFASLEGEQQLRILELNSWQLLRLLLTHLNIVGCEKFSCESGKGNNDGAERFCCLYLNATARHESWKSRNVSRLSHGDDYRSIVLAYREFLGTASMWLSSRSTDKPFGLLVLGIAAISMSCLGLMILLFLFGQKVNFKGSLHSSRTHSNSKKWHLEESFTVAVVFILVSSMASTSMIEEEQYIWHFMTTSLYLILLGKTILSITKGGRLEQTGGNSVYFIIAVLISGRILRGWHQGGVNWSYLPDISKLLELDGHYLVKPLQLLSTVIVALCLSFLLALRVKMRVLVLLMLIYLFPTLIIMKQNLKFQDSKLLSLSSGTTTMIQIIYAYIGTSTVGILIAAPWFMPYRNPKTFGCVNGISLATQPKLLLSGFRDSLYVIGWCYLFSWCLLQMLLQHPINSMPVTLLLVQILASICYFSDVKDDLHLKQWVEVATLYYVGMAGHFGLGNTNTLATIDVAGAFIGISSHSTIISGILMFMITYASPVLALISLLMNVSMKDTKGVPDHEDGDLGHVLKMTLGYPCLVPLGLNSIVLLAYTVMLLLMRNHLFIWSVFSPKYLYVCATTVCVYIGVAIVAATSTYAGTVVALRRTLKWHYCS